MERSTTVTFGKYLKEVDNLRQKTWWIKRNVEIEISVQRFNRIVNQVRKVWKVPSSILVSEILILRVQV